MYHLVEAPRRPPFSDWLASVDRILVRQLGLDSGSLEDWPWHSEFDCGVSPREAAEAFISEIRDGY